VPSTHLRCLIQHCKPVPCNKDNTLSTALLPVNTRVLDISLGLLRHIRQLVQPIIRADRQDHRPLRRVEAERSRRNIRAPKFAHAQQADICAGVEVVRTHVLVPHVIQRVLMNRERRPLAFKLEYDQTRVVPGCKKVEVWVGSKHPEPVVLPPECLYGGSLRQVPHAHGLVLATRDDKFVLGMEESAGNAVEMSPA